MISVSMLAANVTQNFRHLGKSRAVWVLAGVVLGAQGLIELLGGAGSAEVWQWYERLGLSREGFFAGRVWQVFSYGFLHANGWHVGLNAAFLVIVGSRIEHMVGIKSVVWATLLGVLGGGIFHLVMASGAVDAPRLVGISGGCMSLLLLQTTLSPQSRMMPVPVSARTLGMVILAGELLLALADPVKRVPGFSNIGEILTAHGFGSIFRIGHACHFGGGMVGWLLGRWILRPRLTLKRLRRERARREASGR